MWRKDWEVTHQTLKCIKDKVWRKIWCENYTGEDTGDRKGRRGEWYSEVTPIPGAELLTSLLLSASPQVSRLKVTAGQETIVLTRNQSAHLRVVGQQVERVGNARRVSDDCAAVWAESDRTWRTGSRGDGAELQGNATV
ncbi:hypothetical protein SKAU_G00073320 [Synaphobranchus kaupii]|uniref:Uncharacterized protein n=1 Tax=Synaphobranchus kaupii TaxID=118154 RepID=A0A9Q1G899_SYNKA|nr:hypothetical protein SKAU_G00073320 [Synaphobranchus kaupii]